MTEGIAVLDAGLQRPYCGDDVLPSLRFVHVLVVFLITGGYLHQTK